MLFGKTFLNMRRAAIGQVPGRKRRKRTVTSRAVARNWLISNTGPAKPLLGITPWPAGWSSRRSTTSVSTSVMGFRLLPLFEFPRPLFVGGDARVLLVGDFALGGRQIVLLLLGGVLRLPGPLWGLLLALLQFPSLNQAHAFLT